MTDLTVEDLDAFPVWEYTIDEEGVEGQDESWVRPLLLARIPAQAMSLTVATDFECPNGMQLEGFLDVTTAMDFPVAWAVLFVRGTYTYIASVPGSLERQLVAHELGAKESDIFPLKYTLRVLVEGESDFRSGVVP